MNDDDQTPKTHGERHRARDAVEPSAPGDPNIGRRIGPYRIERLLDRGGMGAVYRATRQDDFEQRVALKLVHRDLKATEVLDRFAAERQILARLEHPNIARILDGGSTADGLPFFVMEYVDGVPVDRYCDDQDLPLRQRLALFRQICAAVHFAHQNLVVHRDLKPANILVTAEGVPKLLDFGIAKLLEAEPGADGTQPGNAPMTPAYASPEQILGQAVTTASDVYTLGVLLYELVSGRAPHDLSRFGPARRAEAIAKEEPEPPSVAAGTRERGKALAGDVDAIVAKAMRKEPRERYASAMQLAEDVGRHLDDLPVEAHPATWTYRARKLARRHKAGLAAALLVVGLAVAVTVLWRQAVHQQAAAELARARAERAQVRAERVSEFLEDVFKSADPDAARGDELSLREALDQGREKLADELTDEPEIRAELLATLGTVYHNLGLYDDARQLKEEALQTRLDAVTADRHDLASDFNNLGHLLYELGDYTAAETNYAQALAMWKRLGDDANTALALRNLAALAGQQGDRDAALELYRRASEISDDPSRAASLYGLGAQYRLAGDPERAEPLLRRALAMRTQGLGAEHTQVATVESSLALVLHDLGRLDEARDHLERALATRRRLLGDDHVQVASSEKNLAALLLDQGETTAAGELLERALTTLRRIRPDGDWRIADAESVWGSYLVATGRYEEAEPILLASLETIAEARGEKDIYARAARQRLAALYEARGDETKDD